MLALLSLGVGVFLGIVAGVSLMDGLGCVRGVTRDIREAMALFRQARKDDLRVQQIEWHLQHENLV